MRFWTLVSGVESCNIMWTGSATTFRTVRGSQLEIWDMPPRRFAISIKNFHLVLVPPCPPFEGGVLLGPTLFIY